MGVQRLASTVRELLLVLLLLVVFVLGWKNKCNGLGSLDMAVDWPL